MWCLSGWVSGFALGGKRRLGISGILIGHKTNLDYPLKFAKTCIKRNRAATKAPRHPG